MIINTITTDSASTHDILQVYWEVVVAINPNLGFIADDYFLSRKNQLSPIITAASMHSMCFLHLLSKTSAKHGI